MTRLDGLPPIPMIDIRAGGPVAHAAACRDEMSALRMACLGFLPPAARPLVPAADRLARRWLARSATPYAGEIAAIAELAGAPGVFLINSAYEWGCTAATCQPGGGPLLLRSLDWPFAGMGRAVSVARQRGPAGEFWNVTWPGAVGVLSAVAPGRFAATINQAPLRRRTRGERLRFADHALNAVGTWRRSRLMPPAHALRRVFETATDYAGARTMLARIPVARPVLFALAGTRRDESCVIERTETEARIEEGPVAVANDWRRPRPGWEPRSCGGPCATDSRDRCAALAGRAANRGEPFDWLAPPVQNWATRVAVEMAAGDGTLRVTGFEPVDTATPARQATATFDLARAGTDA